MKKKIEHPHRFLYSIQKQEIIELRQVAGTFRHSIYTILGGAKNYKNSSKKTWRDLWMPPYIIPFSRCLFTFFIGWVGEDIGGTIERYDPAKDQWEYLTKMQEPRFSMGICVYDGLIYLVGGCTHSRRHMQELVSYNPVSLYKRFY